MSESSENINENYYGGELDGDDDDSYGSDGWGLIGFLNRVEPENLPYFYKLLGGLCLTFISGLAITTLLILMEREKTTFVDMNEHQMMTDDDDDVDDNVKRTKKSRSASSIIQMTQFKRNDKKKQSARDAGGEEKKSDDDDGMSDLQLEDEDQRGVVAMTAAAATKKKKVTFNNGLGVDNHNNIENTNIGSTGTDTGLMMLVRPLSWTKKVWIWVQVTLLIVLCYLLLVFLPGNPILSVAAAFGVWVVVLVSYIKDEIIHTIYPRTDRLWMLLGFFLCIASGLSLVTYAVQDWNISTQLYVGPARIVGIDYSEYDNAGSETMQTDLQVQFGSMWACPNYKNGQVMCIADVKGAMCETHHETDDDDDNGTGDGHVEGADQDEVQEWDNRHQYDNENENHNGGGRRHRQLQENVDDSDNGNDNDGQQDKQQQQQQQPLQQEEAEHVPEDDEAQQEQNQEHDGTTDEQEQQQEQEQPMQQQEQQQATQQAGNSENDAPGDNVQNTEQQIQELEDELQKEQEELEEEEQEVQEEKEQAKQAAEANQELEQEVQEQQEENGDLQVDLDSAQEENEALEEYAQSKKHKYGSTNGNGKGNEEGNEPDWDHVWGEYACEDVFEADITGHNFNPDIPPGFEDNDSWPYMNIYGNCRTCEAYVIDYYSTQHYTSIQRYQMHAIYYGIAATVCMLITCLVRFTRQLKPRRENQTTLLTNEGGVHA